MPGFLLPDPMHAISNKRTHRGIDAYSARARNNDVIMAAVLLGERVGAHMEPIRLRLRVPTFLHLLHKLRAAQVYPPTALVTRPCGAAPRRRQLRCAKCTLNPISGMHGHAGMPRLQGHVCGEF